MPHGHKGHKTGDVSLMSLFINMIVDLIVNRKVNKLARAIKSDPNAQRAFNDMNAAADRIHDTFKKWCEENPEKCAKLQNDPEFRNYNKS